MFYINTHERSLINLSVLGLAVRRGDMNMEKLKQFFARSNVLRMFFLLLNSVTWFYLMAFMVIYMLPGANPFVSSLSRLFYIATAVSMLISPFISERVDNSSFILFWVILGIVSSLSPIFLMFNEYGVAAMLILWGTAFGIGFPPCLASISSVISDEKRGFAGGVIFLATYLLTPLLIFATTQLGLFSSLLMLVVWRSLGFVGGFQNLGKNLALLKPTTYSSVLHNRTFLLYLLPWLAFCLVNYSEAQVLEQFFGKSTMALINIVEFVIGAIFCLIGGKLMDQKGRKWVIIVGLVMLGLGYAMLSFFPLISAIQAFYVIVDGIAFGIFTVAFIFVVWGDISSGYCGGKYYALGTLPVLLAMTFSDFASPWLRTLDASSAFSLASFFLFMAVIPIFFAPELLPERVLRERELRKYVERVKEITSRA